MPVARSLLAEPSLQSLRRVPSGASLIAAATAPLAPETSEPPPQYPD
jgi:hypothetical protein